MADHDLAEFLSQYYQDPWSDLKSPATAPSSIPALSGVANAPQGMPGLEMTNPQPTKAWSGLGDILARHFPHQPEPLSVLQRVVGNAMTNPDLEPLWMASSFLGPKAGLMPQRATLYHGTDAVFDGPFLPEFMGTGSRGSYMGRRGFYFTPDPLDAAGYGRYVKQVELNSDNPLIIPTTHHAFQLDENAISDILNRGHDSVVLRLFDRDSDTKQLANSWDAEVFGLDPSKIRTMRTFDQASPEDQGALLAIKRNPYAFMVGPKLLPGQWGNDDY